MTGGFKSSRYGNKFEQITAAAKEEAKKKRTAKDVQDLVKDPVIDTPDWYAENYIKAARPDSRDER